MLFGSATRILSCVISTFDEIERIMVSLLRRPLPCSSCANVSGSVAKALLCLRSIVVLLVYFSPVV